MIITKKEQVKHEYRFEISKLRSNTGLSQNKFASHFGITASTLKDWEHGRRQPTEFVKARLRKSVAEYLSKTDENSFIDASNTGRYCFCIYDPSDLNELAGIVDAERWTHDGMPKIMKRVNVIRNQKGGTSIIVEAGIVGNSISKITSFDLSLEPSAIDRHGMEEFLTTCQGNEEFWKKILQEDKGYEGYLLLPVGE